MPEKQEVILSRYFYNNVELVADMCPRCYEMCLDVRVRSINFAFLKQLYKKSHYNNEKSRVSENFGFPKEDILTSSKSEDAIKEIVNKMEKEILTIEANLIENNQPTSEKFNGFSKTKIDAFCTRHKKVIKVRNLIRSKIYTRISSKIMTNNNNITSNKELILNLHANLETNSSNNCDKYNSYSLEINHSKYFPSPKTSTSCKINKEHYNTDNCAEFKTKEISDIRNSFIVECSEKKTYINDNGSNPSIAIVKAENFNTSFESEYFKMENKINKNDFQYDAKTEFNQKYNIPVWIPPRSPHNLIEESLYHDPWALLVATIFLNKTSCACARPYVFWFLKENPHSYKVLEKLPQDLEKYFIKLGLQKTRALQVWRMSYDYLYKNWKNVKDLYGIGRYGENAFRMFCLGDFSVEPKDRFLRIYKAWYEKLGIRNKSM